MIWVCRAGQKAIYESVFIENESIYLAWSGYQVNLHSFGNRDEFRKLVEIETGINNKTSISNWAGQLYSFVYEMKPCDYVLIPSNGSRMYTLAEIIDDYQFNNSNNFELYHSRKIKIVEREIPREIFDKGIKYSLGAYRTLFKVKNYDEVIIQISNWKKRNDKDR